MTNFILKVNCNGKITARFIRQKALVSHAECITTIFIILFVVFEFSSVHEKMSFQKKITTSV